MMKEKKGITLIALVITIIVLLILAGVSISAISGENGIVTKAKQAKEETEKAGKKEEEDLQAALDYIDSNVNISKEYGEDWEYAWTCTDGVWSEQIQAGTEISDDVDIIAKFYKTGNKITPPKATYSGVTIVPPQGDEYVLVIDGNGEMTNLVDSYGSSIENFHAWETDVAKLFHGQALPESVIVSYVREVIISNGIENLSDGALTGAGSLEKITFGKNVTSLGKYAINLCKSIKTLEIPDTVTEIGSSIFYGNDKLENVVLPNTITKIPVECFGDCIGLKNIDLPTNLSTIERVAFCESGLEEIIIPNKVNSIGEHAFYSCTNLQKVKILTTDENLTIGSSAFYDLAENSVIYVLNENVKTKLEGKYDSSKTTVQVVTEEEMNNL